MELTPAPTVSCCLCWTLREEGACSPYSWPRPAHSPGYSPQAAQSLPCTKPACEGPKGQERALQNSSALTEGGERELTPDANREDTSSCLKSRPPSMLGARSLTTKMALQLQYSRKGGGPGPGHVIQGKLGTSNPLGSLCSSSVSVKPVPGLPLPFKTLISSLGTFFTPILCSDCDTEIDFSGKYRY